MKRFLIFLFLAGSPEIIWAEKAPSIMFDSPDPVYVQKPKNDSELLREDCKQLSQEMERLKGKPVRKAAAAQRYKADCENPYQQEPVRSISQ